MISAPFPGRGAAAAALLLFLSAAPAAASVSLYAGGEDFFGSKGYKQRTLEAGFSSASRSKSASIKRAWLFASRTEYGVKGSSETTATWSAGGGLDFSKGIGWNMSGWFTPAPALLSEGAYRARGADMGLSARWGGLIPGLLRPFPSFLATSVNVSGGWATHEEYFTASQPLAPLNPWFPLEQTSAGGGVTETIARNTWVGGDFQAYSYDHDLRDLSRNLEFLSLSSLGAANAYGLILGFPHRTWAVKAGQNLWTWGQLTASWRRTTYVIGETARSDTFSSSLAVYFWKGFGVRGRYEVSRPQGGDRAEYKGFGVEAGF